MVYESDFYTTRRYRTSPSLSTYTVSYSPSKQVRILPGLGKVHVVHTYDRIVPYVGHKRLTVVSAPPQIFRVRPSVLLKEFDRIQYKYRPAVTYSYVNNYLNSDSAVTFNDETSRIRADAAGLLKRVHAPTLRSPLSLLPYNTRYSEPILTSRITSDDYIYKMLTTSPHNTKIQYTTYYSEPIKRFLGPGHLAAVTYSGGKGYGRRPPHVTLVLNDPVKNDIQLLSYYINKFRTEKALANETGPLSPARPSRHFSKVSIMPEPDKEENVEKSDRAAIRMAKVSQAEVEAKLKRQKEIARLAEEKALAEEAARKKAQDLKEEAARKAEIARQEELAAQAAAERAAELERKAEEARQEELRIQAELERKRLEEEENARLEEERRQAELAKAEEERQQLLRLEEIARQAEEERERELARQAEELAELARQEAELEEQARQEAEALALAKQQEELAELQRQEAELLELEKQEKELAELAKQEAELAELAKHEAELAKQEAEIADLATQEAELAELQQKQLAELDALEAEAKALEHTFDGEGATEESAPQEEESEQAVEQEEYHEEPAIEEPEVEAEEEAEEEE
ncbi:uncharacterized abhydrolase domain-containing protein DDB_G0269086-like isoform X4 [Photinus pyralis]|uniref:uncharacterized abhydrolase domain-containing protein DDB_G0269086-like isoform X4 n=1 Tax=Photinus pyralis TaxID=7054 RepID=UPI0012674BC4|nr:uncharacterized abhydrolase domain-containing protein DDB_G0269086-like isoform X4 [Photinus pyralis]